MCRNTLPPGYTLIRQLDHYPAGTPRGIWARGPEGVATTVYQTDAEAIAAAWALAERWAALLAAQELRRAA